METIAGIVCSMIAVFAHDSDIALNICKRGGIVAIAEVVNDVQ